MTLKVIYEDNHLLVLDKPAGLLTQPSGTDRDSLEDQAKAWLKQKYEKPGLVYLHAIHRLDKAAAGLVLFAKTSKALERLSKALREHKVKKIYRARVERAPSVKEGTLEHYLLHDDHFAKAVTQGTAGAKLSRLHYKMIEEGKYPLLEIDLETGRYHQIRAQLSAIGCPILGDEKYGSSVRRHLPGIELTHCRMEIMHPVTGELLVFDLQKL